MTLAPDDVVAATRDQRLDLCAYLETLSPEQWDAPSLCAGWTVRDVVAHLTLSTRTTKRDVAVAIVKARGSFDRMEATQARVHAARYTPPELIARLAETAGSARRSPGSGLMDPLLDILVHGQDIARALGHDRPVPVDLAVPALDFAVASRFYGARKRFAGITLTATDAAWTGGDGGVEIRGPVADLLLVATGRPAGLPGLAGDGRELLAGRLDASP